MPQMPLESWLTVAVVLAVLISLASSRLEPDVTLLVGVTVLLVLGVLTPETAFAGFASPGLVTVGVLYIVVSGVMNTGAMRMLAAPVLGRPQSERSALLRLMPSVSAMSAFLNNTPVVAMLVPVVQEWAGRQNLPASRLLLPLSYASILGGSCTLIGTSTNLIVNDLSKSDGSLPEFGFFEIAWLGLPCALIGIGFVILTSHWLLPARRQAIREPGKVKEYSVEMLVEEGSELIGKSVGQAGLRQLAGLYLAEIERNGRLVPAVGPLEPLHAGDRLIFVGNTASVGDLYKIRGLVPAQNQVFKLDSPRHERVMVEAVVSPSSPFLGQTIREARFRTHYQAVVIAVARGGRRLSGKVGDIETTVGDTLLVEARPAFLERYRHSSDFLLVSALGEASPLRYERSGVAILILLLMVLAAAFGGVPMEVAALVAAALMLLTRCTSVHRARNQVDWSVLVTIGAAIGLGRALEDSGAAQALAQAWIGLGGENPWLALLMVYLLTSLFTEVITNNAAAVMMFTIAKATAASLAVNFTPFVFVIMMAASASFATPIGYQTNLMVYGPGGYRFSDYLKIGVPLNLLLAFVAVALAPLIWPF